jgi:pyrroline-5-carboxylate reductase
MQGSFFRALNMAGILARGLRDAPLLADAGLMAVQTMAGTAAMLRATDDDTAALRHRVTSPGGSTARGLEALERGGVRAAFYDAVRAVVEGGKR